VLVWQAWKAYAHRAASYQTRALLTVVYALLLGPGAGIARLFGGRLLDTASASSSWIARAPQDTSLQGLRRQF
jgi:hypothetical protein